MSYLLSEQILRQAADQLLAGDVVAFATETVYGLGADASSEAGVDQIYRLKGRPAGHPLIVHVSDLAGACYWGRVSAAGVALAARFWPGPLTLIVPRQTGVAAYACGSEMTIGLRCPSHPVAQQLLQAFESVGGRGIAAPSANKFGGVSPTTADHVIADFGGRINVLDGGACEHGLESTIVDVSRGFATILRPGSISAMQINDVLMARGLAPLVRADTGEASTESGLPAPRAAGTLAAHYAPATRLELVDSAQLSSRLQALSEQGLSVALCSQGRAALKTRHWEAASRQPEKYGQRLYAMLREFDRLGADIIVIERPEQSTPWAAVNDRLQRAETGSGS